MEQIRGGRAVVAISSFLSEGKYPYIILGRGASRSTHHGGRPGLIANERDLPRVADLRGRRTRAAHRSTETRDSAPWTNGWRLEGLRGAAHSDDPAAGRVPRKHQIEKRPAAERRDSV